MFPNDATSISNVGDSRIRNRAWTRREMLRQSSLGFGWVALSGLLSEQRNASAAASAANTRPAFRPRATSVVFLFMGGGPSHVDTFDPKPTLSRLDGQDTPESIAKLFKRTATMGNGTRKLMASPYKFQQYGECGQPVSEIFPQTAKHVDDLCFIRSMQHDTVIHMPGEYIMTTGTIVGDRPSLGAWVHYGLGSENRDLPGFVVFGSPGQPTTSSGFLPARHQGTRVSASGVPNLKLPQGTSSTRRRRQLDLLQHLNGEHRQRLDPVNTELEARIASYELAFRMQTSAPEAFDLSQETGATKKMYGIDNEESATVGTQCLLARRMVERGVRFIQVYVGGWDAHGKLKENHESCARRTDTPVAGLISDLKQRGLLESTLVVWGGEFGRTPGTEGDAGRDHSPGGFTVWLAGAGVKGGQVIGETDEVGYTAIARPVHPNSLHATMLHALGMDQEKTTFVHNGRTEIPTFVKSEVIQEVFA